jgi:hypothetical protein
MPTARPLRIDDAADGHGNAATRAGERRRLVELYEAKGDRAKAAHYYQEFVISGRPRIRSFQPQVAESKKRLANWHRDDDDLVARVP